MVLELPLDVLAMAPRYRTETPSWVLKRAACRNTRITFRTIRTTPILAAAPGGLLTCMVMEVILVVVLVVLEVVLVTSFRA